MKTDFKDYLLSTLSILLILIFTVFLIFLISRNIPLRLHNLSVLIYILAFFLFYGLISAFYLRIINRFFPLKEGGFDMNHSQFTIYKLHSVVGHVGKPALRLFFPEFLRPVYYTLLGAKIGKNVAIGGVIIDPLLTRIEDNVMIGHDSVVSSHAMFFNKIFLKPTIIKKRATLGIRTVIMPGVEIGEESIVAPGAVVLMDTKIPPKEFWGGIPARKIKDIEPAI